MFKIGEKVKLNNEIVTIKSISDDGRYEVDEIKPFKKWVGMGIQGRYVEFKTLFSEDMLQKIQEKTNKISRKSPTGSEAIIEYEIDGQEIYFKISNNPLHLTTVLKILLHETELYNYKYERISPFKFIHSYNKKQQSHVFNIDFVNIKTFEKESKELLRANRYLQIEDEFSIFIPDFLELCVNRNLLGRVDNGYKVNKKLSTAMNNCTYLKSKLTERELEKEGYVIPRKYKEQYSLRA